MVPNPQPIPRYTDVQKLVPHHNPSHQSSRDPFITCTVDVWEWISNFIPQFIMDYSSVSGLKLIIGVEKGAHLGLVLQKNTKVLCLSDVTESYYVIFIRPYLRKFGVMSRNNCKWCMFHTILIVLTCKNYHNTHLNRHYPAWSAEITSCASEQWLHITDTTLYVPEWSTLTQWGRDKMAAIFQTTFSNAFSWMKMFKFQLRFHWSLFQRVQLTIFQLCLR